MITDNMKFIVSEGDVVTIHETSWNYERRVGEPYEAIVLFCGTNGQPLITRIGEYRPVWSSYYDIVKIDGHIKLDRLFGCGRSGIDDGTRIDKRIKQNH